MPDLPPSYLQEKNRQRHGGDGRPSAHRRGYGPRWRRYRLGFLREHNFCVRCKADGQQTVATVVDHVVPHQGPDDPRFWDPGNHQALCKRCHDRKTATQDGGFGR
ncbi:MAG: HNH endonuclease [Candidatus Marinimicrobia bacterium]|nr:HNH endonuclease [Candidatus Neomarinimicrobiota bacterium]